MLMRYDARHADDTSDGMNCLNFRLDTGFHGRLFRMRCYLICRNYNRLQHIADTFRMPYIRWLICQRAEFY